MDDGSGGARRSAVVAPGEQDDLGSHGARQGHHAPERRVKLPMLVELRQGPSGRFFALQSWRRLKDGPVELRFSRWFGTRPSSRSATTCCKWGSEIVKGRATFHGKPIYGYAHTPEGVPLDKYGRNVYLDSMQRGTLDADDGVLTHRPTGTFRSGSAGTGAAPRTAGG